MARIDWDRHAQRYDAGRHLPDDAVAVWMATARRHIGTKAGRILDLGCGTGAWSGPLSDVMDADVVGIEPTSGMLAVAAGKPHPRVRLARGTAEAIPLRGGSCGAAWLSTVIHHFDDLDAAARELRRVLVPGGPVLIRGAFPGREPIGTLDRFFPGTQRALDSFPSVSTVVDAFQAAGFSDMSVEKVEQITSHSLAAVADRAALRADTSLQMLTDAEFEAGLAAIREAAEREPGPAIDRLDLMTLR